MVSSNIFKVSNDTIVTDCFFKDGIIHGPVRKIGMKKFREFRRQLLFVGHFRNGKPFGPCWEYREGGGFVHGSPDSSGAFTGDRLAFIYPDMCTALFGKFNDGVMSGNSELKLQLLAREYLIDFTQCVRKCYKDFFFQLQENRP
jgi:hypothetical protein